jgi:hypothetical protein
VFHEAVHPCVDGLQLVQWCWDASVLPQLEVVCEELVDLIFTLHDVDGFSMNTS